MVAVLDLGPVEDLVAEPDEDVLDLAADLGDQMEVAARDGVAGRVTSTCSSASDRSSSRVRSCSRAAAAASSSAAFVRFSSARSSTESSFAERSASVSLLRRPRYATRASSSSCSVAALRSRPVPQPDSPSPSPPGESSTGSPSPYDRVAGFYDPWSRSVTEDIGFYVSEARKARGTIVELGVGTGRIAVPTAEAGVRVIGVDSSAGMLEVCRTRAEEAGVADLLDLRLGDLRDPPVDERVPLVTCPFRAYLHLDGDEERLAALRAARELLRRRGPPDLRRSHPPRRHRRDAGTLAGARAGIRERATGTSASAG